MNTLNRTLLGSALLMGGLVLTSTTTFGAPMTFTVDPTQSSLEIESASLTIAGNTFPLSEQASGSLVTDYGGTVEADVTATTIEFTGGSSIVASNSGSWQPLPGGGSGSAPANYGGTGNISILTALAALRGIEVDTTSGVLDLTNGQFAAENMVFGFVDTNSVLDWSVTFAGGGTYTLTGLSTNEIGLTGSIATNGNELVLTVPIHYPGSGSIISSDDFEYVLDGTLVAKAPLPAPPLVIELLNVTPTQVTFSMNTTIGEDYTILGRTNLTDTATMVDQFTATTDPSVRIVNLPMLTHQFFQGQKDGP